MIDETSYKEYHNTEDDTLDIKEILFKYLAHWKWFIISGAVCLLLAFLYIRMTIPEYEISSVIMIKDEKKGGNFASELNIFDGMSLMGNSSTENEIEVLKSKSLIRDVIKDLGLYVHYTGNGFLKKTDIYNTSPVVADVSLLRIEELIYPYIIHVEGIGTSSISINMDENDETIISGNYTSFPILLETPIGPVILKEYPQDPESGGNFSQVEVVISSPISVAKSYLSNLTIATTSKNSSVVRLTLKNANKKRGVDFLNALIEKYNNSATDDKNKIAYNTAEFINERLDIIGKELGSTEREIESYKKQEGLTEIKANSELFLREGSEYERKQVQNETQLNLIRFLKEYLDNPEKKETVIPANIGLSDQGLLAQINKYNELLLERNRLLHTTSENNPVVINSNNMIESLFFNIKMLLANVEESLLITQADLDKQTSKYRSHIGNIPTQERIYVEIDRQRQIQSSLFLMLLQKREENALAMAVTTNKAKIIDETLADTNPVSPQGKIILLIAVLLAVIFPVGIVFLKDFFNVRFTSKLDIEKEKLTKVPILAEIPLKENVKDPRQSESTLTEALRLLRTNINFVLDKHKKVILVTSSVPEEGKTFIAVNLALSFSKLNKKVLLIGMDIRNPQLTQFFSSSTKLGLTNFLSDSEINTTELIQVDTTNPNLNYILAGPVPPNPSELLSLEALDNLIEKLRTAYDYIIIDSAPVGVVPDTLILQRVADLTLYVCKANYTHKKNFEMLNSLVKEKKLPNVSLVINAVKISKYGYGGYGYGQYGAGRK